MRNFCARAALALGLGLPCAAMASTHSGIDNAGTVVAIALPLTAAGISGFKEDWEGLADVTFETGATVGTALLLKQFVREKRPDGSDFHSFPSDQAALAFTPAFYLWHRYGWEYGVPAMAAATFVGFARVDSKEHHWWDVATSAVIGFGYDQLITTRYYPSQNVYTGISATTKGGFVSFNYRF
jgi:membrane-associated phospholipid phosphatase